MRSRALSRIHRETIRTLRRRSSVLVCRTSALRPIPRTRIGSKERHQSISTTKLLFMLVLDAPCFRRPNLLRPGEWWSILWPQQLNPMREGDRRKRSITLTTTAVLAHENELCSRNMVLSCTHSCSSTSRQAVGRRTKDSI
jgi:hypothetical protein